MEVRCPKTRVYMDFFVLVVQAWNTSPLSTSCPHLQACEVVVCQKCLYMGEKMNVWCVCCRLAVGLPVAGHVQRVRQLNVGSCVLGLLFVATVGDAVLSSLKLLSTACIWWFDSILLVLIPNFSRCHAYGIADVMRHTEVLFWGDSPSCAHILLRPDPGQKQCAYGYAGGIVQGWCG